jgi:N-acetyl-gamma-glutamylphosphate reductase
MQIGFNQWQQFKWAAPDNLFTLRYGTAEVPVGQQRASYFVSEAGCIVIGEVLRVWSHLFSWEEFDIS